MSEHGLSGLAEHVADAGWDPPSADGRVDEYTAAVSRYQADGYILASATTSPRSATLWRYRLWGRGFAGWFWYGLLRPRYRYVSIAELPTGQIVIRGWKARS